MEAMIAMAKFNSNFILKRLIATLETAKFARIEFPFIPALFQ